MSQCASTTKYCIVLRVTHREDDQMIEQIPLPKNFEEEAKRQFEKVAKPEVTFPIYLETLAKEFRYRELVKKDPQLKYRPALLQMTPCGNGDFEAGLDTTQWQGAYGVWW